MGPAACPPVRVINVSVAGSVVAEFGGLGSQEQGEQEDRDWGMAHLHTLVPLLAAL